MILEDGKLYCDTSSADLEHRDGAAEWMRRPPSSLAAALVQRSRAVTPATSRGVGRISPSVTPAPPLDGISIGRDSCAFTAVVGSNSPGRSL